MANVSPAQVQKYLKKVDYPARKDDLVRTARQEKADREVIETIERLPEDRFGGPNDVSKAIGELEK